MSNRKQPGSSRTDPCASPRLASLNFSANPGLTLIVTKMAYMSVSFSRDLLYERWSLLPLPVGEGKEGQGTDYPTGCWAPRGGPMEDSNDLAKASNSSSGASRSICCPR